MEQKFYTDSFEQLLRETTDEFRMYPSRKVWHSIYNDIHPSRRWPSASVLLLFIVSLLYISGYHVQRPFTKSFQAQNMEMSIANPREQGNLNSNNSILTPVETTIRTASVQESPLNDDRLRSAYNSSKNISLASSHNNEDHSTEISGQQQMTTTAPALTALPTSLREDPDIKDPSAVSFSVKASAPENPAKKEILEIASASEKDDAYKWMQEDVFYNRKTKSGKWRSMKYQLYGTPSFGYRSLKRKDNIPASQASLVANPEGPAGEHVNHDLAMNFEVGANALVRYSKNLRLKAGLQFNFTNYRIRAYELNHPTVSTLTLNNLATDQPVMEPYSTMLANTPGLYSTILDNYTLQLSVPVGADYRIAGRNKIQWYAGATVQPTFVTNGDAYLLSSDRNHYVNDNSLIRRFNINGSLETFVSYKARNGVTLNAGPQVRYQFLSTYSNRYNYDERLYNIGLKLGVTTNF